MVKISIVVPCYNQAKYLPEALLSVLQQSHSDWECIIVNDGSPDETERVAQEWCSKDKRFIYIAQENAGVSAARNKAIGVAVGEYILPLDADDRIHESYIGNGLQAFQTDPTLTVVYAAAEYFGTRAGTWVLPNFDYKTLLIHNLIYSSAIYRRADWQRIGGYDENAKEMEDWEFWIRMLYDNKKVCKIPELGLYYRMHKNSRNLALTLDDEKTKSVDRYIFSKHQKIYEEYMGTAISCLRSNLKLKAELERIKAGPAYKVSTKLVTLALPLKNAFSRKAYKELE